MARVGHGREPSGFTESGEFLDNPYEGLRSNELASTIWPGPDFPRAKCGCDSAESTRLVPIASELVRQGIFNISLRYNFIQWRCLYRDVWASAANG
jgi:hypothetical protein